MEKFSKERNLWDNIDNDKLKNEVIQRILFTKLIKFKICLFLIFY
jgi:hypothetical protein